MKWVIILLIMAFSLGCDGNKPTSESERETDETVKEDVSINEKNNNESNTASENKVYSNERFRKVVVEKVGENQYLVEGEGQIFEANFGWVVEDGHNELKEGYEMTEEGAPAWGRFSFTVSVEKERENSTLTLILYETSPKDGSRQHQLPVVLN